MITKVDGSIVRREIGGLEISQDVFEGIRSFIDQLAPIARTKFPQDKIFITTERDKKLVYLGVKRQGVFSSYSLDFGGILNSISEEHETELMDGWCDMVELSLVEEIERSAPDG